MVPQSSRGGKHFCLGRIHTQVELPPLGKVKYLCMDPAGRAQRRNPPPLQPKTQFAEKDTEMRLFFWAVAFHSPALTALLTGG